MRKIVGTVVLTAMLLVPAQIVMAQEAVFEPVMEMMMNTEMKMNQVMMKMMKAKKMGKMGMTSKTKKKLMKMLEELDLLLDRIETEG
ncbi:MAG: hypothetical protein ACE5IQ_03445 [Candidatus Methylomirabilales bacterium]